jgi:fatty-acyl-CoA synthase
MLVTPGLREAAMLVRQRVPSLRTILDTETAFAEAHPPADFPRPTPESVCFLQFTSGSTSRPKGVMVTHGNLIANSRAVLGPTGLGIGDDDVTVSWLPLYHDMGLGFVFSTIIGDLPAVFLPTSSFARSPRLWLQALARHRGTITYAPNFAYQLVARRVRAADLDGLDLAHVRVAGCGAEPIRASVLRDFAAVLAPTGFAGERAFLPCYGMAESTLAVTFHELGTPVLVDRVDGAELGRGRALGATEAARAVECVSCGVPFPGHDLEIRSGDGARLPERMVGEIVVRGPSVSPGYFRNEGATLEAWREGWLHTGDLGYVSEGNLYVCGRMKDLIIINGANHHPQDIEWLAGEVEGVRRDNVVAFATSDGAGEHLVVVAEGTARDAPGIRSAIRSRVQDELGLPVEAVHVIAPGSLPRTSSGKVQRRLTRDLLHAGSLPPFP